MGYWENTTYLRHGNVAEAADALEGVFAREGMARIAAPPPRARLPLEPMQYDAALENDLWALALCPGAAGWTVLKSAPLELLAERAAGATAMRLADVCRALGTTAVQLNVYDSSDTVLVEVAADGSARLSGFRGQSADPMVWHGLEVREDRLRPVFELHDLAHLLADDAAGDVLAHALSEALGGANAAYGDNLVSVDTLICHKPFAAPGGLALYYRWEGPSRQRRRPGAASAPQAPG